MRRSTRAVRPTVVACLGAAAASCAALVALAAGQGAGQGPDQSVTITARPGVATASGAEGLVAGPARVTFRAAGRGQINGVLARLRPGATLEQVDAYVRRSDAVPVDLVSLVTGGFVGPGQPFRTALNLVPGEYVAISEGQNQRGLGTVARFSVGAGAAAGALPRADSRIQMFDYGFKVPTKIDGDGVLQIDNIGRNEHFIVGIRLNPGVSPRAVRRALVAGQEPEGPPPGEFVSIIGLVSPGTSNRIQASLRPGVYVIACFFADRASAGHEHSEFGMVRQVTVTR